MGKNTKEAAKKAAEQAAAAAAEQVKEKAAGEKKDETVESIVKAVKGNSLSQDGKAITANLIQKRWVEGENATEMQRTAGGFLVDALLGDIIITSFAEGSNMFTAIIGRDENKYLAIKAHLAEQGIALPDYKALPAPTEDQLKKFGVKMLPAETAVVNIPKENVSTKAIDKKKKEIAAVANAVNNPAEIKNAEQLKASLTAMLVKPATEAGAVDRPDARVQRTIDFYRGYLTIQANHAEKKEEELKKVKALSRIDMLNQIAEIVGPCPFALSGAAYLLRKITNETGSPISAFCLYRRGAVPTANGSIEDSYLADVVRILLIWSCNSQIAEFKSSIKDCEKIIKKNEEAVKANEKDKVASAAVKEWNRQLDGYKTKIAELENILNIVTNPSLDIVDNLIDDYNAEDENSEQYKLAHRIVKNILDTYYPGADIKKLDKDVMLKNVQQRAGIVVNMFRDPLNQSISYKESNLTEMVEIEAPAEEKAEEAKGEEAPKN